MKNKERSNQPTPQNNTENTTPQTSGQRTKDNSQRKQQQNQQREQRTKNNQQQQNQQQNQQQQNQQQQPQQQEQNQQQQTTDQQKQLTAPADSTETTTRPVTDATETPGKTKNKPMKTGAEKETTGTKTSGKSASKGSDVEKIKDPDPTIPEKRHDPVGGHDSDYSRTRNVPGKEENHQKGEFTDVGDLDEKEAPSTSSGINEEEDEEEEPGSFDPEMNQKKAFSGEKKNTPDATKNKNGL
jgi:hypothetical protein